MGKIILIVAVDPTALDATIIFQLRNRNRHSATDSDLFAENFGNQNRPITILPKLLKICVNTNLVVICCCVSGTVESE